MWRMRYFLLMIAVVALVGGCASTPTNWISDPSDPNNVVIEEQIRFYAKERTGELTKVDLDKVKSLNLGVHPLTSVKGLEKLTQLTSLDLNNNPDLTKAQIAELKKALPKCKITSNPPK